MNSKCPKYHPSCSVTAQATASAGNNALVRSYTWGVDASGSMQGAGGVGGLLMVNAGSGGVHFPAYDLNGNVMGLVNATNGIISAKYEYGPFGEVFCSVGDMAKVNPFQFSTKYTDNETDFVYYGYRYYSPPLGRWLSRDPIEEQGGLNLYGFVNNDPVNKWDKLGKAWSTTGEAIWTALGYIVPGSEFPSAAMCAPDAARLLIMNKFNAACKRCLIDPPDGDDSSCDKICAEAERVKSVLQRR